MNSNKNIDKSCVQADHLVSYLYNEMPEVRRTMFEDHLSDCGICTDEFADLSLARLGVYEWNRDEFAAMATPLIAIPYEKEIAVAIPVRISLIESWLAPIFSAPKMVTAGAALAALTITLGFVLFAANYFGGDIEVVNVKSVDIPIASQNESELVPDSEDKQVIEVTNPNLLKNKNTERREARRISQSPRPLVTSHSSKNLKANNRLTTAGIVRDANKASTSGRQTSPRLTNFEDESDNTLRLSDLFADVDTRR